MCELLRHICIKVLRYNELFEIMKQKYKILWLCNLAFSNEKLTSTGGWLQPLAEMLQRSGQVEIFNVTSSDVKDIQINECNGIKQWVLPFYKNRLNLQIASHKMCQAVQQIVEEVQPDLVHIWGTENIWVSIYAQGYIKTKTFVDIQGILSSYYYYYYGGLRFTELLKTIHLKELANPWCSLPYQKRSFKKRGEVEIDCLKKFKYISYQSDWVKRQISLINPSAIFFRTKIMLREAFYSAEPWKYKDNSDTPKIFSTASGSISYKGFHILLRAVGVLKERYPHVQLRIAGQMKGRLLKSGYTIYLEHLIKKLGLQENVVFLGSLNESQIVKELQGADATVIPSFVETYCLAFAESMLIGTPTVVSYAGAMPELANHGEECLFYNSMDFQSCAYYLDQLIKDKALAEKLSVNGRKRRLIENDKNLVVNTQLDIYRSLIEE